MKLRQCICVQLACLVISYYTHLYTFLYQQQKQSKMDLLYCLHMCSFMTKFTFCFFLENLNSDTRGPKKIQRLCSIMMPTIQDRFLVWNLIEKLQTTISLLQLHSLISIIAIDFMIDDFL